MLSENDALPANGGRLRPVSKALVTLLANAWTILDYKGKDCLRHLGVDSKNLSGWKRKGLLPIQMRENTLINIFKAANLAADKLPGMAHDETVDHLIDLLNSQGWEPDQNQPTLLDELFKKGYRPEELIREFPFEIQRVRTPLDTPGDGGKASERPTLEVPCSDPFAAPSLPRLVESRRQVTLLDCEIAAAPLPSDAADRQPDFLVQCLGRLAQVITDLGGQVNSKHTNHIVAHFGYPSLCENHARRAVSAGLALVKAAADLVVSVRVGIHTDRAFVCAGVPKGKSVATAAQLRTWAEPSTVFVSGTTWDLAHEVFDGQPLGSRLPLGSLELDVYRIVREHSRLDAPLDKSWWPPLVGRKLQLDQLLKLWKRVERGQGQVALLLAEQGMGKTRLVDEFKTIVGKEARWIEIFCLERYQSSPFYPIIERLFRVLDLSDDDPEETKLQKLENSLRTNHLEPLEIYVPVLADLLGIRLGSSYARPNLVPIELRRKQLEVLGEVILKIAALDRPLVLLVEDLHWADPSTRQHLGHLVVESGLPTARLLLLITKRQPPPDAIGWGQRPYVTQLALDPLEDEEVRAMIRGMPRGDTLSKETVQKILDICGGVPFNVVEETRKWLMPGRRSHVSRVHDCQMAWIDSLSPKAREVAQLASVLDMTFTYDLLVLLGSVERIGEDEVKAAVEELLEQAVFYPVASPHGPTGRKRFQFSHAITRREISNSLSRSRKKRYYQRVANILRRTSSDTAKIHPEVLARFYTSAERYQAALNYWHEAGQKVVEQSALPEAIAHFSQGLDLVGHLPGRKLRSRWELKLRVALGEPLVMTRGYANDEVLTNYRLASELYANGAGTPWDRFRIRWGMWACYLVRSNLSGALRAGRELLEMAHRLNDEPYQANAHRMMGVTRFYQGKLAEAEVHFRRGLELYDPRQHLAEARRYGEDPGMVCYCYLACVRWLRGHPDEALTYLGRPGHVSADSGDALSLAQGILRHPYSIAFALNWSARVYQFRREAATTQQLGESARDLAAKNCFQLWEAMGAMFSGWGRAQLGEREEGSEELARGLASWRATTTALAQPYWLSLVAEVQSGGGRPANALKPLSEAIAAVEHLGETWWAAELFRLKGELFRMQAPDQAEDCFQKARNIARRQGALSLELRAVTSLARLWDCGHRRAEAHRELLNVYSQFSEGFATLDLLEARALLAVLAENCSVNSH